MTYSEIIIMRISSICRQRGIAYNKLASMSGLNQSTIDNIVRGVTKDPRIQTLHRIAIGMNMTLAEFLDFKELNEFSFVK
ncbi:helix-turn-helix domain-containing protein [Papillibacter cinnamivorans]|uniref:Cro/C1-type HTH DNA-binding domain-containing protein n=1 Tax=Papillibacter cinnamivorans DSM 12816 TaxID=1122930 RepID=A0A1W2C957_9FIRM|nr:helix-turn-helix transcriptional regulator [Papillibacter cinnamivorans]SMC81817.1 Cro/C1-type HTH DNA-binding domain-containing protein [Papillibacter cinnamivorans DSM 12816]